MFPVPYLPRILDVPPAPDSPARPLSGLVAVQAVRNATERDQAAPRAAFGQLKIGQTLTGLVLSQAKGVSLVEIEGQTVAMRLPHPAAPGDTLSLRFAGHVPQAVFLLAAPESAASDAPQLSQTARMLSELVQHLPARSALPTLTPSGPLLARPTPDPAVLALALRTALVRSGLFYESHLANWAAGQDSLDGLMREPQNKLAAAEAARNTANPLALLNPPDASAAKPLNPMHALLTQQLQVLESPEFAWRGEVWPGQPLEWHLRHEADPAQNRPATASADESGAGWDSKLKLTLPQLGTVTVHIRLDANLAFSIRMVPEQPETAPLLRHNQGRLAEQLNAAGCTLQILTVEQEHAGEV